MKNFSSLFFTFLCMLCVACASTAVNPQVQSDSVNSKENSSSSSKTSVIFYDNCPNTTQALKVEVGFKITIKNYKGQTEISFSKKPTADQINKIQEYVEMCRLIQNAISKSGNPVSLSFNSASDGSGTSYQLSTTEEIKKSAEEIYNAGHNQIWAIYN